MKQKLFIIFLVSDTELNLSQLNIAVLSMCKCSMYTMASDWKWLVTN